MVLGFPNVAEPVKHQVSIHEDAGSIPGLTQWHRSWMWLKSGVAVQIAAPI